MTATVQQLDVIVPTDRRIVIELPPEVPVGEAEIILSIYPQHNTVNRVGELYGTGKGEKVWMSDDFDEPLEDFKEYM